MSVVQASAAWKRLLLVAAIVGLIAAARRTGAFEIFRDTAQVHSLLVSWPWAYILFLGTFAVLHPLGVSAFFWIVPAGLFWPFPIALALSMTGAVCAATLAFSSRATLRATGSRRASPTGSGDTTKESPRMACAL